MPIDFEVTDHIAKIVINRPEALNSMTQPMYADLSKAWIEVATTRTSGSPSSPVRLSPIVLRSVRCLRRAPT